MCVNEDESEKEGDDDDDGRRQPIHTQSQLVSGLPIG